MSKFKFLNDIGLVGNYVIGRIIDNHYGVATWLQSYKHKLGAGLLVLCGDEGTKVGRVTVICN